MTPGLQNVILNAPFSPYRLQNNAAIYSLEGPASEASYLIDGSNRLYYVADRSGNSAVNGLVLPGVSGNSATTPDSAALSITSDIAVVGWVAANDWTPSEVKVICCKRAASNFSYQFLINTNGTLELGWSTSGVGITTFATSTVAPTVSDFAGLWCAATLDVNNGSGGYTAKFWTSSDGVTWQQLGNTITGGATTSIYDGTAQFEIGIVGISNIFTGVIYRIQIYSGIPAAFGGAGGTLVFDANFTTAAKLATSFTESSSNAATVTINTTAIALPARIHGARDLYQGVQANQPIFSVSSGYNIATFDGSNDYLKSAPFSLSQPESVYFTGSQVSWTDQDAFFDGNASASMYMLQNGSTPLIAVGAGSYITGLSVPLGATSVLSATLAAGSGTLRYNLGTASTGAVGAGSASGFTLGARGDGTGRWGNITWSQSLLRSVLDDSALSDRIIRFFMRKGGIS